MAVAAVLRAQLIPLEEKMVLLWTKSAGIISITDMAGLEYVHVAVVESVA